MGALGRQFPFIFATLQLLPDWLTIAIEPKMASYIKLQRDVQKQVAEIRNENAAYSSDGSKQRTIFHEILQSNLPESEKAEPRLWQDGQVLCVAGTATTASALNFATFHLLQSPRALRKLVDELKIAMPDPHEIVPVQALEGLPYLTGVIQESLRLSNGVSTRLQRVAPHETITFNDGTRDWMIPPSTPIGMTGLLIHQNKAIFPDPFKFVPERWIENPRLDRYLLCFTKGARQCIGINLAYAEMYIAVARVFRVWGSKEVQIEDGQGYLELFEPSEDDVRPVSDMFVPEPSLKSNGVRIKARSFA